MQRFFVVFFENTHTIHKASSIIFKEVCLKERKVKKENNKKKKEKIEKIITKPAPLTSHRFMWPLKGKVISEYGIKNN